MENFVYKGISSPSVFPLMGAVVQLDGEEESSRRPVAKDKVDVLLGYGAEGSALITSHAARYHVGEANLAHKEELAAHRFS